MTLMYSGILFHNVGAPMLKDLAANVLCLVLGRSSLVVVPDLTNILVSMLVPRTGRLGFNSETTFRHLDVSFKIKLFSVTAVVFTHIPKTRPSPSSIY